MNRHPEPTLFKMYEEPSEDLLVIISMRDDCPDEANSAFCEFHNRFKSYVWSVACRISSFNDIPDIQFAETLANNTFVRAFNKASRYSPASSKGSTPEIRIKSWLRAIIKNEFRGKFKAYLAEKQDARNHLKVLTKMGEPIAQIDDELDEESELDENLFSPDEWNFLDKALDTLKPRERDVLLTYFRFKKDSKHLPDEELKGLIQHYQTTPENLRQIKKRAMDKVKLFIERHQAKGVA